MWFSRLTSILIALPTAAVENVLISRKLDAMAYCGIGHNHATRKLLYTIVSHVNDAVQRTVLSTFLPVFDDLLLQLNWYFNSFALDTFDIRHISLFKLALGEETQNLF